MVLDNENQRMLLLQVIENTVLHGTLAQVQATTNALNDLKNSVVSAAEISDNIKAE